MARLAGGGFGERLDDARLADPRFAGEKRDASVAPACRAPRIRKEVEFLLAPHQGRERADSKRVETGLGLARAHNPPCADGLREPLERVLAELGAFEQAADEPMGHGSDDDGIRFRQPLQPGGEIGRLAENRMLLGRAFANDVAGDHQAGGDPDPDPQADVVRHGQGRDRLDHAEAGADRALGVVLADLRIAEIDEKPVAHIARDDASHSLDDADRGLLKRPDQLAQVLGIEARG